MLSPPCAALITLGLGSEALGVWRTMRVITERWSLVEQSPCSPWPPLSTHYRERGGGLYPESLSLQQFRPSVFIPEEQQKPFGKASTFHWGSDMRRERNIGVG